MATTRELFDEFEAFMDEHDIIYHELNREDNALFLAFGGDDVQDTNVIVDFDEEDPESVGHADCVHFLSQSFAKCAKGNFPMALVKVNQLNLRYRWAKFTLSDDGSINCDADAHVYPGSVGDECAKVAFTMSGIIREALDELSDIAVPNEEVGHMLAMIAMMNDRNAK